MHLKAIATVAFVALTACTKTPLVDEPNSTPVANAGPDQTVTSGSGLMLDASGSMDSDGRIVEYRWLSATKPTDGSAGRMVPQGQSLDWPSDVMQPSIDLPMGLWVFSLQVTDEKGAASIADTVTINVGPVPVPVAGAGGGGGGSGGNGGGGAGGS